MAWAGRAIRDWRVRTTLPIIAIHVAAFLGLYLFTYEFAMREVKGAFRVSAAVALEEGENLFSGAMRDHRAQSVREGLDIVGWRRRNWALAIFSRDGEPLAAVGPSLPFDRVRVQETIHRNHEDVVWDRHVGDRILVTGVRVLRNGPACQRCHADGPAILGAVGVQRDLGNRIHGTAGRLRRAVGLVFLGWLALLGVSLVIRERVIGRPLARIEEAVLASSGTEAPGVPNHDLDSLAGKVHGTVWELIDRQRERSQEIGKGMERVTQLAVLGDVAAGLSHEIKNPLAGIRAALGALRRADDLPPGERSAVVEEMISEVDRVNRTVDTLLSLARPRSLVRAPADPGRLVRKATALLEPRARSLDVALSVSVESDLPQLDLDSDLIIQVVVNLVTNALDAVIAGGSVLVTVEPLPERDGAAIVVADDGEGIPAKAKGRIFEPFFTTKRGGTGLGLPLCLRIVEQHGGTITVESEPGRGTTFAVLLPSGTGPVTARGEGSGVHTSD